MSKFKLFLYQRYIDLMSWLHPAVPKRMIELIVDDWIKCGEPSISGTLYAAQMLYTYKIEKTKGYYG